VLRTRLEQERVAGDERDSLVEARTVFDWHSVVVVAADAVNAGDVAHQLARGDGPWLFRVRRKIALDRRIEIKATPIVQKRDGDRRQGF
jgi:hypothetical protein